MFYKTLIILIIAVNILASAPAFAAVADIGAPVVETFRAFGQTRQGFITFLSWLFPLMLAVATIAAVVSLIWAGFEWMAGAISPPQIESAQKRIWAAVSGLALALGSWLILNTINPDLLSQRTPAAFERANEFCASGECPTWDEILFGVDGDSYSSSKEAWTDAKSKIADGVKRDFPETTDEQAKAYADSMEEIVCYANPGANKNQESCRELIQTNCESTTGGTDCKKAIEKANNAMKQIDEQKYQTGYICTSAKSYLPTSISSGVFGCR